jgi:hypothetical protein
MSEPSNREEFAMIPRTKHAQRRSTRRPPASGRKPAERISVGYVSMTVDELQTFHRQCQPLLQRREQVDYGPPIGKVYIHSPEDLILYKLMYFGLSQQSKHSRDIAAILKSKKDELDVDYIEGWAAYLGLSLLWKEMLDNVS